MSGEGVAPMIFRSRFSTGSDCVGKSSGGAQPQEGVHACPYRCQSPRRTNGSCFLTLRAAIHLAATTNTTTAIRMTVTMASRVNWFLLKALSSACFASNQIV